MEMERFVIEVGMSSWDILKMKMQLEIQLMQIDSYIQEMLEKWIRRVIFG